jgi:hypothetical protein
MGPSARAPAVVIATRVKRNFPLGMKRVYKLVCSVLMDAAGACDARQRGPRGIDVGQEFGELSLPLSAQSACLPC